MIEKPLMGPDFLARADPRLQKITDDLRAKAEARRRTILSGKTNIARSGVYPEGCL